MLRCQTLKQFYLPLVSSSATWSYSACSFYTTYTPAFHSSEPTDVDGILPPILDTGATHCLLPLSWLTNEQSLSSKKIHLKVASGATVRALLYQNVIYCATVSRPLISVGQLKAMLDLRMVWDDSSPSIHACSGGLRYILMEASVFHNLPVITHHEMRVLLQAIDDFTRHGTLYNASTWSKKLGRKLALFHWSSPITSLPPDHATFTDDPQVNFSSLSSSSASSCDVSTLPSTVQIVDLELQDPPTDDETTKTRTKKVTFDLTDMTATTSSTKTTAADVSPCLKAASLPCQQADSLPCLQAAGLPCASTADEASERASCEPPTESEVENAKRIVLEHSLPRAKHRTNVSTKDYVPRGRLFGGFATRGEGVTNATFRYPEVVSAIHVLAATRPKGFTAEPYLCVQLNAASSLPLHKDKNNFSRSWLLGLGDYEGGRLWVESPVGTDPPPCAVNSWQKALRGEFIDVRDKWTQFDPQLYHCVEPVTRGERRSIALFSPRSWKRIPVSLPG